MALPPGINVVASAYMGPVTIPKQGSRVVKMGASPFNYNKPPTTPPGLYSSVGNGCFYGLDGFYTDPSQTAWGTLPNGSLQLAKLNLFNFSSFGIFDISSNGNMSPLTGNSGYLNTGGTINGRSIVGRNGLYSAYVAGGGGSGGLEVDQLTVIPRIVTGNTTINFASQTVQTGFPGTATSANNIAAPVAVIDDNGNEHFGAYTPSQQQIGINIYRTGDLLCDFSGEFVFNGLIMATPSLVLKNGIQNGITAFLGGLNTFAVSPHTGNWIAWGNTGAPNLNAVYIGNVFCPVIPGATVSYIIPGHYNIVLSDPVDQANLTNAIGNTGVATTVLPGGGFAIFTTTQAFLFNEFGNAYIAINGLSYPGGDTFQSGIDFNGNIWTLGSNHGNYTGTFTSFHGQSQPLWINPPLLNSFGVSCRVSNVCTESFMG